MSACSLTPQGQNEAVTKYQVISIMCFHITIVLIETMSFVQPVLASDFTTHVGRAVLSRGCEFSLGTLRWLNQPRNTAVHKMAYTLPYLSDWIIYPSLVGTTWHNYVQPYCKWTKTCYISWAAIWLMAAFTDPWWLNDFCIFLSINYSISAAVRCSLLSSITRTLLKIISHQSTSTSNVPS